MVAKEEPKRKQRRAAIQALFQEGALEQVEDVVARLEQALHDGDSFIRRHAARLLGRVGGVRVCNALSVALRDENERVRGEACLALGALGQDAADVVGVLVEALGDEAAWVRTCAAGALASLGPAATEAVSPLCKVLKDPKSRVSVQAAQALGQIGDASAIPALVQTVQFGHTPLKKESIRALGTLGPAAREAVQPLLSLFGWSGHRDLWPSLAQTLRAIGLHEDEAETATEQVLEALAAYRTETEGVPMWQSSHILVLYTAPLGLLGSPAAVAPLLELFEEDFLQFGYMRDGFSQALSQLGPAAQSAVPYLCSLLGEYLYNEKVALSLGSIGPGAVSALCEVLAQVPKDASERQQHKYAALALGLIGEPAKVAIPALLDGLHGAQGWGDVQARFCEALGRLGAAESQSALMACLQQEDTRLQCAAARALGRIQDPSRQEDVATVLRQAFAQGNKALQMEASLALFRRCGWAYLDALQLFEFFLHCLNPMRRSQHPFLCAESAQDVLDLCAMLHQNAEDIEADHTTEQSELHTFFFQLNPKIALLKSSLREIPVHLANPVRPTIEACIDSLHQTKQLLQHFRTLASWQHEFEEALYH